jgi:hypothetical protein
VPQKEPLLGNSLVIRSSNSQGCFLYIWLWIWQQTKHSPVVPLLLVCGMVARQELCKHIPVARSAHATIKEMFDVSFSLWSMLYQRKMRD